MRSVSVTLTAWLVLILSALNLLRAWTSIAWRDVLAEFSSKPAPLVGAVIGGMWAGIGFILWLGINLRKAWAGKLLPAAAAGYTVWYWGERFLFQNPRPNAGFAILVNAAILIIVYFASKSLSREAYERTTENPNTE
jgi:hypothetical protein